MDDEVRKKQPGSITRCGKSWRVAVPVDRDPTSGKLIYHRATVQGRQVDAIAYRDRILAEVPPERVAPLYRPRKPPQKRPPYHRMLVEQFGGPSQYHVRKAYRELYASNPPPRIPRPAKLSHAEVLAVWSHGRTSWERSGVLTEIIERGLWRLALLEWVNADQLKHFVQAIDPSASYRIGGAFFYAGNPERTKRLSFEIEREKIIASGVLACLKKTVEDLAKLGTGVLAAIPFELLNWEPEPAT